MAHLMARVIDGNWQVRAATWDSLQEVTVFVVISVCETDFSKPIPRTVFTQPGLHQITHQNCHRPPYTPPTFEL